MKSLDCFAYTSHFNSADRLYVLELVKLFAVHPSCGAFFFWRLTYYESLSAYRVAGWEKFPYNTSMMWGMETFEGIRVFFLLNVDKLKACRRSSLCILFSYYLQMKGRRCHVFDSERALTECQPDGKAIKMRRWRITLAGERIYIFLRSNRSNDGANTM